MRRAIVLALAIAAAPAVLAQAPDGLVRVDAIVTDARGRLVTDLAADDFSIVEDGTPRPAEAVTWVAADGAAATADATVPVSSRADEEREAGRGGARLFAVFLDEYHLENGPATDRAREWLAAFIEHTLGPRDLVVVVKPLDSLLNLRLTHDRAEAAAAIRALEGRKGDYVPRNAFEQNYIAAAPVRVEAVRSQIVTSAIAALATHLGSLGSGRKSVIVLTEGFASAPRRRDEALPTIESVARAANRASASIYPIDPRAFDPAVTAAASSSDAGSGEHEVLRTLAAGTDGRAILVPGDQAAGVPRLAGDVTAYYVVAFRPAHPNETSKLHPIEFRVKRPNVTVHGRPGYWSASPDELWRARQTARAAVQKPPEPMRHASPLIRPWFGLARGSDGKMAVSFVWEPVPPVPGERIRRPSPVVASVKATMSSGDGGTVFEGEVRPANQSGETPSEIVFESPPGRLLVQIAIQDADARVLDTDVRDVIVGALAGPVELGTPEVMRTRNAREYRAVDADPDATPTAAREFSRSERLLIRVPVYGAGSSLSVTAKLSSKLGSAMRELPILSLPGTPYHQIDLPLAGLASGEYAVDVSATATSGNARESVAFRVTP